MFLRFNTRAITALGCLTLAACGGELDELTDSEQQDKALHNARAEEVACLDQRSENIDVAEGWAFAEVRIPGGEKEARLEHPGVAVKQVYRKRAGKSSFDKSKLAQQLASCTRNTEFLECYAPARTKIIKLRLSKFKKGVTYAFKNPINGQTIETTSKYVDVSVASLSGPTKLEFDTPTAADGRTAPITEVRFVDTDNDSTKAKFVGNPVCRVTEGVTFCSGLDGVEALRFELQADDTACATLKLAFSNNSNPLSCGASATRDARCPGIPTTPTGPTTPTTPSTTTCSPEGGTMSNGAVFFDPSSILVTSTSGCWAMSKRIGSTWSWLVPPGADGVWYNAPWKEDSVLATPALRSLPTWYAVGPFGKKALNCVDITFNQPTGDKPAYYGNVYSRYCALPEGTQRMESSGSIVYNTRLNNIGLVTFIESRTFGDKVKLLNGAYAACMLSYRTANPRATSEELSHVSTACRVNLLTNIYSAFEAISDLF